MTKRTARGIDGKTYDVPGNMSYTEWRRTYVEHNKKSNTAPSGAITDSNKQQKHAELYYREIRKRKNDVLKIVNATGWKAEHIEMIKNHVFIQEHLLEGRLQRFYPNYDQAQAWQRLTEGKSIKGSDIVFLRHEFVELTQMRLYGYKYYQAHRIANKRHNWVEALREGRLYVLVYKKTR